MVAHQEPLQYFVIELPERVRRFLFIAGSLCVNLSVLAMLVSGMQNEKPASTVIPIRFFEVAAPAPAPVQAAPAPNVPKPQPVKKEIARPAPKKAVTQPAPAPAAVEAVNNNAVSAEPAAAASQNTAVAAAPAGPVIVTEPRYRHTAPPQYPAAAVEMGVQGTVILEARVNILGKPTALRILQTSGSADLDQAAVAAVQAWEFEPTIQNGIAVESAVRVPVKFALN